MKIRLECMECGSQTELLKLTLTDMDGVLLDQRVVCWDCAVNAGWEPGAKCICPPSARSAAGGGKNQEVRYD